MHPALLSILVLARRERSGCIFRGRPSEHTQAGPKATLPEGREPVGRLAGLAPRRRTKDCSSSRHGIRRALSRGAHEYFQQAGEK